VLPLAASDQPSGTNDGQLVRRKRLSVPCLPQREVAALLCAALTLAKTLGRFRFVKFATLGTRGIPDRYGGFETFAEELSTRLAARGRQVTVYCRQKSDVPKWGRFPTCPSGIIIVLCALCVSA
jgi:hypothetical protein